MSGSENVLITMCISLIERTQLAVSSLFFGREYLGAPEYISPRGTKI